MVEESIVNAVQLFLGAVQAQGVTVLCGVLFGSHVYGQPDAWSDVDVVVVSPDFDLGQLRLHRALLRRIARESGQMIDAIPCGEAQWVYDDADPIIETARRQGVVIQPPQSSPSLSPAFYESIARAKQQAYDAVQRERLFAERRERYEAHKPD